MKICVNIACGDSYLVNWLNFDFSPHSSSVRKANLLDRLPLDNEVADVVYSSHFIEHIPRDMVSDFVSECHRITKSGGHLRIVLPDWQELCTTYLTLREGENHEQADFLLMEMLDQCVRRFPGGELGAYYKSLQDDSVHIEMIDFVYSRTGHNLNTSQENDLEHNFWEKLIANPKRILSKLEAYYVRLILTLLPSAFRTQNVSLTEVGEKHAWMYDFYTVKQILLNAGYKDVQRMTANSSNIPDFPFDPLDMYENGMPRKGSESMYIEAIKV